MGEITHAEGSSSLKISRERGVVASLRIIATFTSVKMPYDLEICVADVIARLGDPTALRDGPTDLVMLAGLAGEFPVAVSFHEIPTGTRFDLRLMEHG